VTESFYEIVVDGPLPVLKGFVVGHLTARGLDPNAVWFADEREVQCESFGLHLAEWMRLHVNISHLLVPQSIHPELKRCFDQAADLLGVRIRSDKPIRSASFKFKYSAYSQAAAKELDDLLSRMPDRVRLSEDYQPQIVVDRQAEGIEMYTPAHAYEVRGSGTATGDLEAIIELHRLAKDHELMKVERISLCHPDD
jgi:hypothetical protein